MDAAAARDPVRRFTVDEVLRMVETGILDESERLELLDGELCVVTPQGLPHASAVSIVTDVLANAYRGRGHVRPQLPLPASPHDLPEPDIAVVPGRPRDYTHRFPRAGEAWIVLEIAVTSHRYDARKIPVYARAGVRTLWLLDVPARRLTVHEEPADDGTYAQTTVLSETDDVSLPALRTLMKVGELLP